MSLHPEVRAHVEAIEARLVELDDALAQPDPLRLEACAQDLHRTLADSLSAFRHASATGADAMSADLRHRLSLAQTRVIQLQQNLHYATHAISRTLDVLLPREADAPAGTAPTAGPRTRTAAALNAYKG